MFDLVKTVVVGTGKFVVYGCAAFGAIILSTFLIEPSIVEKVENVYHEALSDLSDKKD